MAAAMQLQRRWSDDATWLVITPQINPATRFLEPPMAANDAVMATPWLTARSETADLLGAIARAASWLMAEAIFGLAACGAATYPSVLNARTSSARRR